MLRTIYTLFNKKDKEVVVNKRTLKPQFVRANSMLSTRLSETSVFVPIKERIKIEKRYMISATCKYSAKSIYHVASILCDPNILNIINRNDHSPLRSALVFNALDDKKGAIQHKVMFTKNMLNERYSGEDFYNSFSPIEIKTKLSVSPNTNNSSSISTASELHAIIECDNHYGPDIQSITATMDTIPLHFPGQKQSNPDFILSLYTNTPLRHTKLVYQDEKSGIGMFDHSTSGSIGVITADQNGQIIPIFKRNIDHNFIIHYNKERLKNIPTSLKIDDRDVTPYESTLHTCNEIISGAEKGSSREVFDAHKKVQNILWNEMQLDPNFQRSLSFVFIKEVDFPIPPDAEKAFEYRFKSLLNTKDHYNMNNTADRREILSAMLLACKDTLDPDIIKKVTYLHEDIGVPFHKDFLFIVSELIKNG